MNELGITPTNWSYWRYMNMSATYNVGNLVPHVEDDFKNFRVNPS